MEIVHLSSTVGIKTVSEGPTKGVFEVEGLFAGYGLTMGNTLRRTLLSSLPGVAVTQLRIKNVLHEFSTLPGVKEDMVELSLNFKKLRFRMHTDEPQALLLKARGETVVTAADIKTNADVEIVNPEEELEHLTAKSAELDIELRVERGLGYSAVEARKSEGKLPVGTVAIDAIFSPVRKVNYEVENMRVGDRTDYNRLRIEIETDGTLSPSAALRKSASVLRDHFDRVFEVTIQEFESEKAKPVPKKKAKKE